MEVHWDDQYTSRMVVVQRKFDIFKVRTSSDKSHRIRIQVTSHHVHHHIPVYWSSQCTAQAKSPLLHPLAFPTRTTASQHFQSRTTHLGSILLCTHWRGVLWSSQNMLTTILTNFFQTSSYCALTCGCMNVTLLSKKVRIQSLTGNLLTYCFYVIVNF